MAAKIPIGVVAIDLSSRTEALVSQHARSGHPVFVDSGAFGAFRAGMGEPEWRKVIALYDRLTDSKDAPRFSLVAPDRVGDQLRTLDLIVQYRDGIRRWAARGARVLVPHQVGQLNLRDFHAAVVKALAGISFVVALPCRAAATTPIATVDFLRTSGVRSLHLLGAGVSKRWSKTIDYIEARFPQIVVTHDANRLRSAIGDGRPVTDFSRRQTASTLAAIDEGKAGICWCDATELSFDILNTPRTVDSLSPSGRRVLAQTFGVSVAELTAVDVGAEGEYGCRVGEFLATRCYGEDELWLKLKTACDAIARDEAPKAARRAAVLAFAHPDGTRGQGYCAAEELALQCPSG